MIAITTSVTYRLYSISVEPSERGYVAAITKDGQPICTVAAADAALVLARAREMIDIMCLGGQE